MTRGRLRIYLGAAPGVGKTYAMLNEGWRRRQRGADVVVGFIEDHGRALTAEQVRDLEVVPRLQTTHRGQVFEEMDLDAVLARTPEVALVDELAHTNVPGTSNGKRWQDVAELLDAGIDVISTLNVQHLESLNDVLEQITGVHQRETIPDEVVRAAEQVELVDMTPEAIRRRLAHGNIYAPEKIDAALANYFRPGNLGVLRELALHWVADRVDDALLAYRTDHGIDQPWETRERVVVALTGAQSGGALIRRSARMAQRAHADLLGVHVRPTDGRAGTPSELLEDHRQLLEGLGGVYHEIVAPDVPDALVRFARTENATQLVLGSTRRSRWAELTHGSVINAVIRRSGQIDVHVISTDDGITPAARPAAPQHPPSALSARRRATGWALAVAGTGVLTLALTATRDGIHQPSRFLLYQALVLVAAAAGGAGPAITAALASSFALNWYFTPPLYTWTIDDGENVLALVVFLAVGLLVALLVTGLARRSGDAQRARAQAETLARVAGGLVGADDPIPSMLERVRTTLDLSGVALYPPTGDTPLALSGAEPPPGGTTISLPGGTLRLTGPLSPDDQRVVGAFAAQLATALERRALQQEAASAAALAETDSLRTALLRAVSHDLRSPLASIKASVTSLLQGDIDWSPEARKEFLLTIDEEADRLDRVVANLLDASRLQAGAIRPDTRAVALDDVVPGALASITGLDTPIDIDVPGTLPLVRADPGLLERAVANLVANAARATPSGPPVRVTAGSVGGQVELRVVDRGPGVPPGDRVRMFEPFQRVGDTAPASGVGLGLAVAKGVVEVMGGELTTEDTPGGGLTMVIALPRADDEH